MNLSKAQLRQHIRQQRRSLSTSQQQAAAKSLCQHITHSPVFARAQHIGFYLANDGEISPEKILDVALQQNKLCYLPVINQDGTLQFKQYQSHDVLIKNSYGIPEPREDKPSIAIQDLDLVLVPLVAFDQQGNRIGMGGGFYDKTFADKRHTPKGKPKLVGLAHSLQKVNTLECEEWDIPIDTIATEHTLLQF